MASTGSTVSQAVSNLLTDSKDALGDRAKFYEMEEAGRKFMRGVPILARLDGRSFHTFTKNMDRPYYEPMSLCMIETARHLVHATQAKFAYTQSDEITLCFWNENPLAEPLFDNRVQKLTSILASTATVAFNREVLKRMSGYADAMPMFDCRVWAVPSFNEVIEVCQWRSWDAEKNSITMAAGAVYPHKELQGKSSKEKLEMLKAKGIDWNEYPDFFKRGVFVQRKKYSKELTAEEMSRIPEDKRPTGPVVRSEVVVVRTPPFSEITNPVNFLFHGDNPRVVTPLAPQNTGGKA